MRCAEQFWPDATGCRGKLLGRMRAFIRAATDVVGLARSVCLRPLRFGADASCRRFRAHTCRDAGRITGGTWAACARRHILDSFQTPCRVRSPAPGVGFSVWFQTHFCLCRHISLVSDTLLSFQTLSCLVADTFLSFQTPFLLPSAKHKVVFSDTFYPRQTLFTSSRIGPKFI